MITKFSNSNLFIETLVGYVLISCVYALLLKSFLLSYDNSDLTSQSNIHEALFFLVDEALLFILFFIGAVLFLVPISLFLTNKIHFKYNVKLTYNSEMNYLYKFKRNFVLLDFSNPFLAVSKTKSLRE